MGDLTIDELARQTGFTVRNVRSHQTRGLLPGPEMRGRVGYYGDEHVERLRLIQQLQEDGLPLRLVEKLLAQRAESTDRLLALRRTVLSPLQSENEPAVVTVDEILERFGEFDEEMFQRAVALGAIVPRADGTIAVPNPALLDTAEEVVNHGVPLVRALRVAQEVQRLCQEAARSFVDMVYDEVWSPFNAAGQPEEQWPQIAATIDQVRPLANEIFLQLLPPAIAAEIEQAFGAELREQAETE
ncbi:MAG: MerR family transcriptional regulator [Patulibacter minatonensis]